MSVGQFVWYELLTKDLEGAKAFYPAVLGWTTQKFDGSDSPYTMWVAGETPMGGVMQLPPEAAAAGAPSNWLPYIGVDDVDGKTAEATGLGATVFVPPTDIPNVGRFAVLKDPQGASFALYASSNDTFSSTPEGRPGPGHVSWHELAASDHDALFDFYSRLFGWKTVETHDMGPIGTYRLFGLGGGPFGGTFNKLAEMPGPPHWLCYMNVADIEDAVERVRSNGGTVLNGPMEVPGGDRIAQCMDPQGAAFAIHMYKN